MANKGVGMLLVCLLFIMPASGISQQAGSELEIDRGVRISYSSRWLPAEVQYGNARELLMIQEQADKVVVLARMLVTSDRRPNHVDAVHRLREIAQGVQDPTELRFLEIGGWPALERVYMAPLPRRGQDRNQEGEDVSPRMTTAVAADDRLLRFETTLALEADRALLEEARAVGRSASFQSRGDPDQVAQELQQLRDSARYAPPQQHRSNEGSLRHSPGGAAVQTTMAITAAPILVQAGFGELEIAISENGHDIVIGANSGYSFSNDDGETFTFGGGTPAPFANSGDPSLATGASGTFYYAYIGQPAGQAAANNINGCTTGISASTDNGATFGFVNHAVVCPLTGLGICFPDQEHIASDVVNSAPGGGDQVYSVWRNFTTMGAVPTCRAITTGTSTASIVCSQDGGANWTAPVAIDGGSDDFPRLTVASDGFVYVVYRDNNNLMLNKYSSCSSGLTEQEGFPVLVTTVSDVACPVAGLDRCNNGNLLSSHMVAVDDTNPNHVYVAFANNTAANNDDVIVLDSTDGGETWERSVTVNADVDARRFMPWVCALNGNAFVSWYDRRAASTSTSDLTEYFLGSARPQGAALVSGPERNLSTNPDPQCASGWPSAPRAVQDAEACSQQPQLAGVCMQSGARCDFSDGCALPGDTCNLGGGRPKYGDYNGNACAANRIVNAWASATAPAGLPNVSGITVFSEVVPIAQLIVRNEVLPPIDPGRFNLQIDGVTRLSNAPNGGTTPPQPISAGEHSVGVTGGTGTNLADYVSVIGGACAADGTVSLAIGEKKVCTVSNFAKSSEPACLESCKADRDICLDDGILLPQQCIQIFNACRDLCDQFAGAPEITVDVKVVPASDSGRFDVLIDGILAASDLSGGDSTGPQVVSIGFHTVSVAAGTGTDIADYLVEYGDACNVEGTIGVAGGQKRKCTITNIGPRLTVNNVVQPVGDPGRFNLRIDGVTHRANAGNGATTGPVVVSAGEHTVGVAAGTGTSLSDYVTAFSGACSTNGTVTLGGGDNKICIATNTAKSGHAACVENCTTERDICLDDDLLLPSQCIQMFNACLAGCPP